MNSVFDDAIGVWKVHSDPKLGNSKHELSKKMCRKYGSNVNYGRWDHAKSVNRKLQLLCFAALLTPASFPLRSEFLCKF